MVTKNIAQHNGIHRVVPQLRSYSTIDPLSTALSRNMHLNCPLTGSAAIKGLKVKSHSEIALSQRTCQYQGFAARTEKVKSQVIGETDLIDDDACLGVLHEKRKIEKVFHRLGRRGSYPGFGMEERVGGVVTKVFLVSITHIPITLGIQ